MSIDFNSVLRYCPESGNLYWKVNLGQRARIGKLAGSTCQGYKVVKVNGTSYLQHRVIYHMVHGGWPEVDIDHKNGNGLDNTWKNLRSVTTSTNCKNRRLSSLNTSGVVGVSKDKRSGKWLAQYTIKGTRYSAGGFNTKEEAAEHRAAKISLDGDYHENHGRVK